MKTYSITGLTAEQMATLVGLVSDDAKMTKLITTQFTAQMVETAIPATKVEPVVDPATAAAPAKKAPAKKAPAKKPVTDAEKKAARAAKERERRAAKKAEAAQAKGGIAIPPPPTGA